MIISELIKQLQAIQVEQGDVNCLVWYGNDCRYTHIAGVPTSNDEDYGGHFAVIES